MIELVSLREVLQQRGFQNQLPMSALAIRNERAGRLKPRIRLMYAS
jgi:hypothetical protein